ncbi:MAG: hypothetical protein R2736_03715 [Solirubrobacterales bacterium]
MRSARGGRPGHRRARLGDAVVAELRRGGDGRHRDPGGAEHRGEREHPGVRRAGDFVVVDTGDPLPDGFDAVVMREHVHRDAEGRAELRAAVPPYQHVRTIGEDVSATELLLPEGTGCARSTSPRRPRRARRTCSCAAARSWRSSRPATRSARSAPTRRPA